MALSKISVCVVVDNSGWPHLFDAFMKTRVQESKECSEYFLFLFLCVALNVFVNCLQDKQRH